MFSEYNRRKRNKEVLFSFCNVVQKIALFLHWKCFLDKDEFIKKYKEKEIIIKESKSKKEAIEDANRTILEKQEIIKNYRKAILEIKRLSADNKIDELKKFIKEI